MTTKPQPATQAPKAPAEPGPCQCFAEFAYTITKGDTPEGLKEGDNPDEVVAIVHGSCGQTTLRTFAPGHDAKLKGVLLRAARRGEDYAYVDGAMLVYANPQKELEKRGWLHLLVILKPRPKKERKPKAAKAPKVTSDTAGDLAPKPGFHPIQVRIGRWTYDGQIVASQGNGDLVSVEYVTSKGETKAAQVKADQIVG